MNISWTPTARHTYYKILAYVEESWSNKEVRNLINEVEKLLVLIEQKPYMFESSRKSRNVRKAVITKHNTLYYRLNPRKN